MRRISRCALICAVAAAAGSNRLAGQSHDFVLDVWTTDDGLPQNSVNEIVQTSDGYLWLGTFGGLVRFDGVRFTVVQRADSAGTHLDRVLDMVLARGDTLWLGTESGLLRYAGGQFRHWGVEDGVPGRAVRNVALGDDGSIWLDTPNGLARVRDGRIETLADTMVGRGADVEGAMWRARGNPRFVYREKQVGVVERVIRWDEPPMLALETIDGARWYVHRYGGEVTHAAASDRQPPAPQWTRAHGVTWPTHVLRDREGRVWIGNDATGVQLVDVTTPGGRAVAVNGPRVPGGSVSAMFVDREGTLWVGTNGDGLVRIKRKRLHVGAAAGSVISAILEHSDGRLLLGTNCNGLLVMHAGEAEVRRFDWPAGGNLTCATALAEGRDGALWVGGYGTFQRVQGAAVRFLLDANGRTIGNILALHAALDSTVWAGKLNGGLYAFAADGTYRSHYGMADGLGHDDVRFITEDSTGVLWIGTTHGMGRRQPNGRIDWFTMADGLPSEQVRAILPDPDGTVWIGTYGGGLARLRDGRFMTVGAADGLGDDIVSSILEDDAGNFWMSGNRGIFRVHRAALDAFFDGDANRVHSVLYGRTDGMLNAETNGGFQPAAWRARDGRFWFPTMSGAVVIQPGHARTGGAPPPAVIEGVVVNGDARAAVEGMQLEAGRPFFEIQYTGLSFTAPEHIVFRYRLLGYEEAWTDAHTRRVAYYPRLPPGRYRFQVIAANRDGVWGPAADLTVRARPAFHETLWFRAGLALLFVTAIVSTVAAAAHRRMTAVRRSQEAEQAFSRALLEQQEAERRRIAGELHDGLGQDLLLVKNYAALALMGDEPGVMREHVAKIGELATGALGSVRSLALTLTPRQLEHVGITQALRDMLHAVQAASHVNFTIALDDIDDVFTFESTIHVFRIVQEAVSNVLKHADARAVDVAVVRSRTLVRLSIADDGRGFDARQAARSISGLGLDGIRQRVRMLSGSINVESAAGAGTRITALLPIAHGASISPPEARRMNAPLPDSTSARPTSSQEVP